MKPSVNQAAASALAGKTGDVRGAVPFRASSMAPAQALEAFMRQTWEDGAVLSSIFGLEVVLWGRTSSVSPKSTKSRGSGLGSRPGPWGFWGPGGFCSAGSEGPGTTTRRISPQASARAPIKRNASLHAAFHEPLRFLGPCKAGSLGEASRHLGDFAVPTPVCLQGFSMLQSLALRIVAPVLVPASDPSRRVTEWSMTSLGPA